MKPSRLAWLLLIPLAFTGGCRKETNSLRQTAELEKAFPGIASIAPAPVPGQGEPASKDPEACVRTALLASRTNDVATAVIMLQKSLESPGLTPGQVMAVQATRKAWVADLMTRAEKGDDNAKLALMAIENAN